MFIPFAAVDGTMLTAAHILYHNLPPFDTPALFHVINQ